jgi:hypothetical protein
MVRIATLVLVMATSASCKTKFQPQAVQVVDPGPPERVLPTIRVLDHGMTPLAPLRYRVPPGQTEVLYLEIARVGEVMTQQEVAQGAIPPVQLEVKIGPAEPTPRGFIRHSIQITQVRLSRVAEKMSPAQREKLEQTLAPLLQVRGWSEMDIQGRVRRGEFQGMEDVPPNLRTMLGNIRTALLTVPFPDEPLGVRAKWEVERKLQFSGVWIDQVVAYEISQMNGDQLALQITARQSAEPQAIPSGRLEAYQSSVIGSSVVRLDHFVPFSEAEAIAQMRVVTRRAGSPDLVRIDTRTAVRLYPAEAAKDFDAEQSAEDVPDPEDAKVITDPGKQRLKW